MTGCNQFKSSHVYVSFQFLQYYSISFFANSVNRNVPEVLIPPGRSVRSPTGLILFLILVVVLAILTVLGILVVILRILAILVVAVLTILVGIVHFVIIIVLKIV